jgi:hypothetical protein
VFSGKPVPERQPFVVTHCRHCGDVIGVYEPYALIGDGSVLISSQISHPLPDGVKPVYHLSCYGAA